MNLRSASLSWSGFSTSQLRARVSFRPVSNASVFWWAGAFSQSKQILFELILADQELAFVVEPAAQQRPLAQQRLVRHFDNGHILLLLNDEQARPRQALHQRPGLRRQHVSMRAGRRTYSPSALTRTIAGTKASRSACKSSGEGLAAARTSSALRRTAFSSGESCPASVAEGAVGFQREVFLLTEAVVEFAQRKGQQRQGVIGCRIVHGGCDQSVVHRKTGHASRAFNDVAHPRQRHGLERKLFEGRRQSGRLLQLAQIIGAQGHGHQEGQAFILQRVQNSQKLLRPGLVSAAPNNSSALIDRDQDLRLV
jgi:hypothetical protein